MKPPVLSVTLTKPEPGDGWQYCVLRRGGILADSHGEAFDTAALALKAAFEEAQCTLHAIQSTETHE